MSAFAGKGKAKGYNLLRKNNEFVETYELLGTARNVTEEIIQCLERFCCALYAGGEESDINKLRYKIYCAKHGKLESDQLPPCK